MTQTFNPAGFISDLAQELVSQFGQGSHATTPGLKGSSREVPVRNKLERLLPPSVAVGSGCIIDSYGNTSSQIDIVLYEKNICPSFCVNDDPSSTYYPCEGVIAVGEIKSTAGSKEISDAFNKIRSVKKLKRYSIEQDGLNGQTACFRKYGSSVVMQGAKKESYSQDNKRTDQVFGFMLTGNFSNKPETICNHFNDQYGKITSQEAPNIMISLSNGMITYIDRDASTVRLSPHNATGIYYADNFSHGFEYLLYCLYDIVKNGRTVDPVAFKQYFISDKMAELPNDGRYQPFRSL